MAKALFRSQLGSSAHPFQEWLRTLAAVVIACVAGYLGYLGYTLNERLGQREIASRYVDTAISILREDPRPEKRQLRSWAITILDQYSEVKLSDAAKQELETMGLAPESPRPHKTTGAPEPPRPHKTTDAPAAHVIAAPVISSVVAGDAKNTITWSAVTGATAYDLYWKLSAGVTKRNGTKISGSGVTSPYVHSGLINGMTYWYVLVAHDAETESDISNELSGTPNAP